MCVVSSHYVLKVCVDRGLQTAAPLCTSSATILAYYVPLSPRCQCLENGRGFVVGAACVACFFFIFVSSPHRFVSRCTTSSSTRQASYPSAAASSTLYTPMPFPRAAHNDPAGPRLRQQRQQRQRQPVPCSPPESAMATHLPTPGQRPCCPVASRFPRPPRRVCQAPPAHWAVTPAHPPWTSCPSVRGS